jgi:hypothetical protein
MFWVFVIVILTLLAAVAILCGIIAWAMAEEFCKQVFDNGRHPKKVLRELFSQLFLGIRKTHQEFVDFLKASWHWLKWATTGWSSPEPPDLHEFNSRSQP